MSLSAGEFRALKMSPNNYFYQFVQVCYKFKRLFCRKKGISNRNSKLIANNKITLLRPQINLRILNTLLELESFNTNISHKIFTTK